MKNSAFVAVATVLLLGAFVVSGSLSGDTAMRSDIKSDEHVVFFDTAGWYDETDQSWHLPVHGWIYEPEQSRVRKAAFAKVLKEKFDLEVDDETEVNFERRLNLIIADNERGKQLVIDVADRQEALPQSADNGHIETTLTISEEELSPHVGNSEFSYRALAPDGRSFAGKVRLVAPQGLSIISDIDDTIKISGVTDRRALLENTFLKDFEVVPGIADVYRDWLGEDGSLHFVSSSPWQLYEPLHELIEQSGFPRATLNLKPVRFRDETFFDLFKKGTETKPAVIKSILDRYPQRDFVLVGDSGEQDPEVYADLLRQRPLQIKKAYLRNVTNAQADDARFTAVFEGIDPARWQLFTDSGELDVPGLKPAVEGLDVQVSEMARDHDMSGVVLVAKHGEPVLEKAFNVDSLRATYVVVADSTFAVASITKSLTATLVLRQVESGRIDLDAPFRIFLPEFNAAYADEVTVRQLLQNRSGIPHYVDIPGWFDPEIKSAFTPESFLAEIEALELRFAPGEDYYYSNANYYLLGLILEAVTGESYEALLQKEILTPLGLRDSGQIYSSGSEVVAPTYLREGDTYERIRISNTVLFRATASLYSSPRDLLVFGHRLMQGAMLGDEMRELLLDPDRPMGFTVTSVPLSGKDVPVVTYNGELAGTTSMLTMFPEQGGTVVILANNNVPYSALVEMTLAIAETAFGE